jgi:hypothetical protein
MSAKPISKDKTCVIPTLAVIVPTDMSHLKAEVKTEKIKMDMTIYLFN